MDNIVKLSTYRAKQQEDWLKKNKSRLFNFLYDFISLHIGINFIQAFESYQNIQICNHQEAWDYTDLRDLLHEGMAGPFCDLLYSQLRKEWWFNHRMLSKEEALEHCLSLYIMDSLHNISRFPKGS